MCAISFPLLVYVCTKCGQFSLGVAAGDVTDTSAILWTRADAPGMVMWELSTAEDFSAFVQTGTVVADPSHDLTIKADVSGLTPATHYFYRFHPSGDTTASSIIGTFHTAPAGGTNSALRFVFSGDTNFAFAPFPAMGAAADENADFCIWFGDTIYGDVPSGGLGVATTRDDYRAKYRQVRSDPNVQTLLARMALWAGWDDHEIENDYAGLDPALPAEQKAAAYQAFFEYLPVRSQRIAGDLARTYRSFRYGSAAEFFMLDERQYRETSAKDACGGNVDPLGFIFGFLTHDQACSNLLSAPRQMLGPVQLQWLEDGLLHSRAPLKFVVNNVPLSHIGALPYDRWDGYDAQRKELLEFIDANQVQGVVFLTTDIHGNADNPDLSRYFHWYRHDYNLPNGVAMPEIITGPFGNETLRAELLNEAASVLNLPDSPLVAAFLDQAERRLVKNIRDENGMVFIEDDRVGYVVIDARTDGTADVTYRGLSDTGSGVETTYSGAVVPPPAPPPCGSPIFAFAAMSAWFVRKSVQTSRRSSRNGECSVQCPTSSYRSISRSTRASKPAAGVDLP